MRLKKNQKKSLPRRLIEVAFNSDRFNDSVLYRLYLKLRRPDIYKSRQRENSFYASLVGKAGGGLVFDIGANGGAKTALFRKIARHVVCVEPSPALFERLNQRFARVKNVTVIGKGAGAIQGSFPFHMFSETDCYNTFSSKWTDMLMTSDGTGRPTRLEQAIVDVPVTTLDLLIEQFGLPCYIKIDVEGFEVEVLKGLTRPVKLLSIECNLPEFESETIECITRLSKIQSDVCFNYSTSEPPTKLALENWIPFAQMRDVILSRKLMFMEIYAWKGSIT